MVSDAAPPAAAPSAAVVAAAPVAPAPAGRALVDIPAGDFVMGRDAARHGDETPAHRVTVSAFRLEPTLVTVAEFRAFVDATGYRTSAERLGYGPDERVGALIARGAGNPNVAPVIAERCTWRETDEGLMR